MRRFKFNGASVSRQVAGHLFHGENIYDYDKYGIPVELLEAKSGFQWLDDAPKAQAKAGLMPTLKEVEPVSVAPEVPVFVPKKEAKPKPVKKK